MQPRDSQSRPSRGATAAARRAGEAVRAGEAARADEAARIRRYYAERDRPGRPPNRAIAEASRLLVDERRSLLSRLLAEEGLESGARLLDVGCGTGADLHHWLTAGWPAARLHGVDLVAERLEAARAACPGVDLRLNDGASLPFTTGSFDVATAATVFSSIRDAPLRRSLFGEMLRVVRPGGLVVVYDFAVRKPTNRRVVAMTRRRLDEMGRRPDRWFRVSPLLQLVALAWFIHPRLTPVATALAPRTHFLACWRVREQDAAEAAR